MPERQPGLEIYYYVGPPDIWTDSSESTGFHVGDIGALEEFFAAREVDELDEPFTYIVDILGRLTLGPRRSEHIACAGGRPVMAAGEIGFARLEKSIHWSAEYISNQSAGYCPGLNSWPAVARALDSIGISHENHYTNPIVFRKCAHCDGWNVVKEEFFVCSLCDSDLPVDSPGVYRA
ncbi:hypothetical protein [Streptomyces cyaneofuscatus]|uniref:hypothetical protein n=1 Tax=Streptomyces cyaneofuscatus TaxID=66883 RepID=UPI00331B6663